MSLIGDTRANIERRMCLICSKPFVNLVALEQHMSSKHPIDAAQPHRYVFSADDAGNVDAAMKYWCMKTFKSFDALQQHYETKHPDLSISAANTKKYASVAVVSLATDIDGSYDDEVFLSNSTTQKTAAAAQLPTKIISMATPEELDAGRLHDVSAGLQAVKISDMMTTTAPQPQTAQPVQRASVWTQQMAPLPQPATAAAQPATGWASAQPPNANPYNPYSPASMIALPRTGTGSALQSAGRGTSGGRPRPRPPLTVQDLYKPGDAIDGKFTEDDQWYRAQVEAVYSNGQVLVLYVDYGNRELLTMDRLRRQML